MNIALIFAGGTGKRMHTNGVPKQFLELYGKPIIIYTLEKFENHEQIHGIVVSCLKEYIPTMWKLCQKFHITKVKAIVAGGETGQESIYNGLIKIDELFPSRSVVLVHDGVRPLIDHETIAKNIQCVMEHGTAITVTPATETILVDESAADAPTAQTETGECVDGKEIGTILDRKMCQYAKAPQSFILADLLECHEMAREEGRNEFIDSAGIMRHYGKKLYTVEGKTENIKITTPVDFYIFKAIETAKESQNAFGL